MPSLFLEWLQWSVSPYLNRFLQPDTIIPDQANPQSWNRFSYVINNPIGYNDPSGHGQCRTQEDCDDMGTTPMGTGNSTTPELQPEKDGEKGDRCNNSPECLNKDDDVIVPDCWHSTTCRNEWANNVGAFATTLDDLAAILNGTYAVVGDLVIAVCQVCAVGVLGIYQYFSYIPNALSTLSMGLWFAQGVLTGENSFSYSKTSEGASWSLSVSQDTLLAVGTNALGWTVLREPNLAFGVDALVAGYDHARSGTIPFTDYTLPAWINPTLSYNTSTGIDFSWQQN